MSARLRPAYSPSRRFRARACFRVALALLCVPLSSNTLVGDTSTLDDQQSAASIPASPANISPPLEEAKQLQQDADRLIEERKFADATQKTEAALTIRRQVLGAMHPDVAYSASRLGIIAFYQGQYERAEAHLTEALTIRQQTLGADHVDVAQTLNDLATVIQVRGDYVRPERMYQTALGIYEKTLTTVKASPRAAAVEAQIAELLSNLGRLYYARGDYLRSEAQYLKALALREKRGSGDPGVAEVLANVGGVYYSWGRYDDAVRALERALAIQEKQLPPNHPSMATSNFNLAAVYLNRGDFRSAVTRFERALSIDREALDPQHPRLATRMVGLAEALRLSGEYARADVLYEQALAIRERSLGSAHPDVATTIMARALLRHATGDVNAAADLMLRAADLREDTLALVLTTGSEEQKRLYLRTLSDETDIAISLDLSASPRIAAATRLALTAILQRKGRVVDAVADQMAALRRHLTDADRDTLDRLSQARSRLATTALRGVSTDQQRESLLILRRQIEELEQAISARSGEFRAASARATLPAIEEALPTGTALVEFASYRPFLVRNAHDVAFGPPRYAAYVLRSDGMAAGFDLGEAAVIEQHVQRFRAALSNPADRTVQRAGRTLHGDLMAPLHDSLRDVERIIVSPDGALNLIPFAALADERDAYLVQRFTISYVASGRDLTRFRTSGAGSADSTTAVIVANPQFEAASRNARAQPAASPSTRALQAGELAQVLRFAPLPGTGLESAALQSVLPGARVYTGINATEAQLKAIRGPSILHIATHGFFLRPQTRPSATTRPYSIVAPQSPGTASEREEALVRSGLALAGANQRSSGDGEDGLLTALEVTGLDLWGTRMVVLSACETGVGEVKNGEGVYGLRRALVLAGSESQVMSLWRIPDAATRDLMVAYYGRLRAREGRAEALRQVQLAMLNGERTRTHPFYWAGFIESGDWRPAFD